MNFVFEYDQPRCETCRFWLCAGEPTGECFRYPPLPGGQLRPNANGHGLDWTVRISPETGPQDFCGEHQPIPNSVEQADD
jgi:hypothetical protein